MRTKPDDNAVKAVAEGKAKEPKRDRCWRVPRSGGEASADHGSATDILLTARA